MASKYREASPKYTTVISLLGTAVENNQLQRGYWNRTAVVDGISSGSGNRTAAVDINSSGLEPLQLSIVFTDGGKPLLLSI